MKFKKISYDSESVLNALKRGPKKHEDASTLLRSELLDSNVIYFYYKDSECKYVGETDTCLWDRCTVHENPQKNSDWFKECNTIYIIKLDDNMDIIARQTLEATFILALSRAGHNLYNKEA